MLWFKPRTEDPARVQTFKNTMEALRWDSSNVTASLSALFGAVDDLADAELRYYYRRRRTRAWISGITRIVAWVAGSLGFIAPMLDDTNSKCLENFASLGYAFLAVSASALAANALFGGTEGHVRFVKTQLEIERLMTRARVGWCEYLATQTSADVNAAAGFEKVLAYASELHAITIEETGRWGDTLMRELARYESSHKPKADA